jgi:PRTRC genetic system protein A
MFNVYIYNEGDELPKDDVCYILTKDGILLKKKVGLMESISKVDKISILGDLKPHAKLHIEKIPGPVFAKIYSFFKEVYKEFYSECVALLYYNPKTKKYKTFIPNQEVSGASLDYVKDRTFKDHVLMCSIHSHASMSAFHSGTDSDDEKSFDGLHITLGKMNQDVIDISASIVANGTRFMVDPLDYVHNLDLVEFSYYNPNQFKPAFVVVDGEKQYTKDVKTHLGYVINGVSDKDKEFDKNWMRFVKKKTYSYTYSRWVWDNEQKKLIEVKEERSGGETVGSVLEAQNRARGGYPYYGGHRGREDWWTGINERQRYRNDEHTSPRYEKYNPCKDCIFRDHKLRQDEVSKALEPVADNYKSKTPDPTFKEMVNTDQELMELYDEFGLYRYW